MALSPDMLKEHFENTSKCKVKWTIYKVDSYENNWCSYNLKLYIKDNDINYVVNWILPKKDCIIDSFNIVFFEKDLTIWKNINYILDEKFFPLEFYSGTVNINNINYCTWNIIENKNEKSIYEILNYNNQIYIFSWVILLLIIIIWLLSFKIYKSKNQE